MVFARRTSEGFRGTSHSVSLQTLQEGAMKGYLLGWWFLFAAALCWCAEVGVERVMLFAFLGGVGRMHCPCDPCGHLSYVGLSCGLLQ